MYDIAIIGAGPAGLNAAIYAVRYGLKPIVIGAVAGGLAGTPHEIGNWLGIEKISGFELTQNMVKHVKSYGTEMIERMVESVIRNDEGFEVAIAGGQKIQAKTVLLATGSSHRHLGVPGEHELIGKGVSYCATCDGFFYKGKTVAVIGGNDAAAGAAVFLGDIAEKVYVIYRKEPLRAEKFWQESIAKNPKIKIIYNTTVSKIIGDGKVTGAVISRANDGESELALDGIFIEIGSEPNSELMKDLQIDADDQGYVVIDQTGQTTAKGVWAAGDLTTGSNKFRQIVTAASEGAIAAASISKYLKTK